MLKEQVFTASGSQFQELCLGHDKLPGLSRSDPQVTPNLIIARKAKKNINQCITAECAEPIFSNGHAGRAEKAFFHVVLVLALLLF